MKIAFLFSGQGSQTIGMGKDIYEKYEEARKVYEKVKDITSIDIANISFEGPENVLNQTKYTQIAVLTMSLAILSVLKKNNINAEMSAGLSLGEYGALIYSKAISFEEGIRLIQKRGEYMQELVPKGDWQMAAILGLEDNQVYEICEKVKNGFVVPANYNCPGQVAISGEKEAVETAANIAKENGAKKVMILKTAGPFHTIKLKDAADALDKELNKITINELETKVIKNIDGMQYTEKDNIKEILKNHIISPVKFTKTIETMLEEDVDTFIEIGPGKALSGFVKRANTDKKINILNINNVENLEDTIKFIQENK